MIMPTQHFTATTAVWQQSPIFPATREVAGISQFSPTLLRGLHTSEGFNLEGFSLFDLNYYLTALVVSIVWPVGC